MSRAARIRLAVVFSLVVAEALALRRLGYRFGGNVVVRCRQGHLFTTLWLPGGSLKSVRLGWVRLQRCPVGRHWTLVKPVRRSDLSDSDRRFADSHHDLKIP